MVQKTETTIKLADIGLSSFNPRKFIDETALSELAESIKKHGVIQPIVVRPTGKNKYEVVAGERRYRASLLAGLTDIPATVKELSDDDALEIAITENLQREDVHPMNEAASYRQLQEQKGYTVAEIALRLGKTEKYVTQRLKLNDLADGFQKMFFDGKLLLGHALELCKLVEKDQLDVLGLVKREDWNWKNIGNESVAKLKNNIKGYYRKPLAKATFDTNDAELIKEVGPCGSCQFNTAVSCLLFADDQEAFCTNTACFQQKTDTAFNRALEQAINDPNTLLIYYSWGDDKKVKELRDNGHEVYQIHRDVSTTNDAPVAPEMDTVYREDYETDEEYNEAVSEAQQTYLADLRGYEADLADYKEKLGIENALKGFYLNGHEAGTFANVKQLANSDSKIGGSSPQSAQIAAINQKITRGRELDGEKVHAKISEALFSLPQFQENGTTEQALIDQERSGLIQYLYDTMDYTAKRIARERLGLDDAYRDSKNLKRFATVTEGELAFMVRLAIKGKYANTMPSWNGADTVRSIAEHYIPSDIQQYELDQEGIRDRREAKLVKLLEDLKNEAV